MPRDPFAHSATRLGTAVRRRRWRRAVARYRRPASAAAAALLSLVLIRLLVPTDAAPAASAGTGEAGWSVSVADAAAGRVLVSVVPAEPAVLAMALPGRLVDVYAASAWVEGAGAPAERVAHRATVVAPPDQDPAAGSLPLPLGAGPEALAIAVTEEEAARIASVQGQAVTVAVLPDP